MAKYTFLSTLCVTTLLFISTNSFASESSASAIGVDERSPHSALATAQRLLNENEDPQKILNWYTKAALNGDKQEQARKELAHLFEQNTFNLNTIDFAQTWYSTVSEDEQINYQNRREEHAFNQLRRQQVAALSDPEHSEGGNLSATTNGDKTNTLTSSMSFTESNALLILLLFFISALVIIFTIYKKRKKQSDHDKMFQKPTTNRSTSVLPSSNEEELKATVVKQNKQLRKLFHEVKRLQSANHSAPTATQTATRQQESVDRLQQAYSRLGFVEGAKPDANTIKQRYKQLSRIYHPDANGRPGEMQQLNHALKIILDSK